MTLIFQPLEPSPHTPKKWHCSLPSLAVLWPSGCFDSDLQSWEELSVPRCKILLLPWEAWGYISAVCRGRNSPFILITCPYLENTNRVRLYCEYVHSLAHLGQDFFKQLIFFNYRPSAYFSLEIKCEFSEKMCCRTESFVCELFKGLCRAWIWQGIVVFQDLWMWALCKN